MLSENVRAFLKENHRAVMTTFRADGGAQMSIVTCGLYRDGVAFTTPGGRAKLVNLKRNQRCSLLVSKPEWYGYVVLEGRAKLLSPGDTDSEELKSALRDVFVAAADKQHPDWEEYDKAMRDERRSVVIVDGEKVYGPAA